MVLVFAIMYFLIIRPQQKQVKAHKPWSRRCAGRSGRHPGRIVGKVSKVQEDGMIEVKSPKAQGQGPAPHHHLGPEQDRTAAATA